jgi:hypothetical protein
MGGRCGPYGSCAASNWIAPVIKPAWVCCWIVAVPAPFTAPGPRYLSRPNLQYFFRRDPPVGRPTGPISRWFIRPRPSEKDGVAAKIPSLAAGTDVDCGSLADGQHSYETFGGKPRSVTAYGRDRPWASSSLAAYIVVREGLAAPAFLRWTVA